MDYGRPDRIDALAAEYVAGTLRGGARRRFETLLGAHPALQRAVAGWQARLLPLTGALPPVAPPPRVWARIEATLWPAPAPQPWWHRLALWRTAAAFAGAAALVLAVQVARPPPVLAPIVVVLESTGDPAGAALAAGGFVASVSGDGRALVTRPLQRVALAPGRVLELWSVPPAGNPRSLGLIDASGATVLDPARLPPALLGGGTAALAVSIEPPGGSPTGLPTGPVVYAGRI